MKIKHMKPRQNVEYEQFVPHREQQTCDEKDQLATAVFVCGCSLLCKLDTVHR